MINLKHLLKVSSMWVSIVYIICYAGVAIYPPIRALFMRYALHGDVTLTSGYFSFGNFIVGLVIWNIVALFGVGLFVYLFNGFKKN